ncbi:RHS repeat-associated core domain-containing protein, partial [Pseudomonas sp. dw_358]|uniref:RHS repeat-associated core domain-containing protein n=1 Tax=Pseudomonas sp. dw_358 TaxID=2720083 RepID=UPI001BD2F809
GVGAPNEDVDGDGNAPQVALRFPGQVYDATSQLSYNYYRDYNAQTGRYVQSDPIGLEGGINTYGYVGGNPLSYIDQRGTNPILGAELGASAGSAVLPLAGTAVGAIAGAVAGYYLGDKVTNLILGKNSPLEASYPPGVWPADKGAAEWGKRNGLGAREGKGRFHGIKQRCPGGSNATDAFGVNPETGDVYSPDGDLIDNLGEVKSK